MKKYIYITPTIVLNGLRFICLILGLVGCQNPEDTTTSSSTNEVTITASNVSFTRDGNGNIVRLTDATGNNIRYEYDPLDRLIAIKYPDNSTVRYDYDAVGLVTRMVDSLGTTKYEYDIHGRLIRATDPNKNEFRYQYDANHLLTGISYPGGSTVTYSYDAYQRLQSVRAPNGDYRYEYDQYSRPLELIRSNGLRTSYRYDAKSRLSDIKHSNADNEVILAFSYQFDERGNLTELIRQEAGSKTVSRYDYDDKGNLIKAHLPQDQTIKYAYDAEGRRSRIDDSQLGSTTYHHNENGQLTSIESAAGNTQLHYDQNGNLIERLDHSGHRVTFDWDYEDRLTKIVDGAEVVTLAYDGNGTLMRQTANGNVTTYLNDASGLLPVSVIGECHSPCTLTTCGLEPLGYQDIQSHYDFLNDGLGSVAARTSDYGRLVDSYRFDHFAQPLSDLPPIKTQVTGLTVDSTTGIAGGVYDLHRGIPLHDLGKSYDFSKRYIVTVAKNSAKVMKHTFKTPEFISPKTGQLEFFGPDTYKGNIALQRYGGFNRFSAGMEQVKTITNVIDIGRGMYRSNKAMEAGMPVTALAHLFKPAVDIGTGKLISAGVSYTMGQAGIALANGAAAVPLAATASLNLAIVGTGVLVGGAAKLQTDIWMIQISTAEINRQTHKLRKRGLDNLRQRGASVDEMRDYLRRTGLKEEEMGDLIVDAYIQNPGPSSCPPNCGPGGGSGGSPPPGGNRPLGGVALDRSAEIVADLRDLKGATIDPATGQLILIGHEDMTLPPMNLDDLVVAIRTIYSGQEPSMSIEPCHPGNEDGCMKIHYNGRFQHPDHPDAGWLTHDAKGRLVTADTPADYATRFGWVIFEADRYLKTATLGIDNLEPERDFQTNVEDYASMPTRMAGKITDKDHPTKPTIAKCLIEDEADRKKPSHCHSLWFVPDEIVVKTSPDGRSMEFEPVSIRTEARFVRFDKQGRMVDVPGDDEAVDNFVEHFNQHYGDFAREKEELGQLIQLAKIVGLVRWLRDNTTLDLRWMSDYQVTAQETPLTTSATEALKGHIGIYGGVGFPLQNNYKKDQTRTDQLAQSTLLSRPSYKDLTWVSEEDGEKMRAAAIQLTPSLLRGGFTTRTTHAAIPVAPRLTAEFTLQYHSLDSRKSPYGTGWSLNLPSLSFRQVPSGKENKHNTNAILYLQDGQSDFSLTTEGFFRPTSASSLNHLLGVTTGTSEDELFEPRELMNADLIPALPDAPVKLLDSEFRPLSYTGFTVVRKDGTRLAFDPRGRLVGVRSANGHQLTYRYNEDGRLAAVADNDGKGFQLTYNDAGYLAHLEASNGYDRHYIYNDHNHLLQITDNKNKQIERYTYDDNGLLTAIYDTRDSMRQAVDYDDLGRIAKLDGSEQPGWNVTYDDQSHTTNITAPSGFSATRQFDRNNRLILEADSTGRKANYEYDTEGHLVKIVNGNGHATKLTYDQNEMLSEIISPIGHRTRILKYNQQGLPGIIIDPADRITLYEYDNHGNSTRISSGYKLAEMTDDNGISYQSIDPITISYQYDPAGQLTTIKNPDGSSINYTYDELGNLTGVKSAPAGNKQDQPH